MAEAMTADNTTSESVDPVAANIKQIIDAVFSSSGQKLSADDPIIGLLLYIKKQQITMFRQGLKEHEDAFFLNLDKRLVKINQNYEAMEKQKDLIVSELMGKNKRMVKEGVQEELQKQKPKHETAFFIVLGILIFAQVLLIILTFLR